MIHHLSWRELSPIFFVCGGRLATSWSECLKVELLGANVVALAIGVEVGFAVSPHGRHRHVGDRVRCQCHLLARHLLLRMVNLLLISGALRLVLLNRSSLTLRKKELS